MQIGRIWHRMYPIDRAYLEILTIFPEDSQKCDQLLQFIYDEPGDFWLLWGGEEA